MTPEEQDLYLHLTAELDRLSTVKQSLADLAASVYAREGARSFQVNGAEVLLCTAKNGAPYFAARSRWAKKGKTAAEKPAAAPQAPKVRTKRAIVNGQIMNVPVGRIIEATAVLRSSARIREEAPSLEISRDEVSAMARDQAEHLTAMIDGLPEAVATLLPDMQGMVPELQTKMRDQADSLTAFAARMGSMVQGVKVDLDEPIDGDVDL